MKRVILSMALLSAAVIQVSGQGTLLFKNDSSSLVKTWASGSTGLDPYHYVPAVVMSGNDHVQLIYAPAGTPGSPLRFGEYLPGWIARNAGWVLGPSVPLSVTEPGLFDGGAVSLSGVAPGAEINYAVYGQVLHFDYPDYDNLFTWIGVSDVFSSKTGIDAASAVPLTGSFTGMVLRPDTLLPEPSGAVVGILFGVLFAGRRVLARVSR